MVLLLLLLQSVAFQLHFYLHSNMVLLLRFTTTFFIAHYMIYIPIWCYFYSPRIMNHHHRVTFTFQYGATSTFSCGTIIQFVIDLHSNMVLLLLVDYRYIRPYLRNLHSNMVLLLRLAYLQKEGENEDLHSNMVLLLLQIASISI